MADSYVCSGATMKCSMGTSQAKLTVLPSRTVFLTGQPMANISDHLSMVNLAPFGKCRSMGFPATASATAANHGSLTPMPCMHNTPFLWMGGKNDYIVKGDPALLKSSTCQCMWGGTISIVDDGQRNTGPADLRRIEIDEFEKDQVKTDGLSADEVLDGIQMTLDVAGMVPVLGAAPDLLNAAISALRGNWLDAGMSLVAAVPGAGDAIGGAKIVKDGVKLAAKKSSKNVVSLAEKRAEKKALKNQEMAKWTAKDKEKIRVYTNEKQTSKTLKKAVGQKGNEVITNSIETTKGNPFGSVTVNSHKVNPVNETIRTQSNAGVAKRTERNLENIKKENKETLDFKSFKQKKEMEEKELQKTKEAMGRENKMNNSKEWNI